MNSNAAKAIDSNKEWLKQIIERIRFTRESKRFYEFFMQMSEQRSKITFPLHGAPHPVRSSWTWPKNFGSENWLNECLTQYLNLYLSRVQLWFDNYMAVTCVSNWAITEYLSHFFPSFYFCFVHVIARVNRISNRTEWHWYDKLLTIFCFSV